MNDLKLKEDFIKSLKEVLRKKGTIQKLLEQFEKLYQNARIMEIGTIE